MIYCSQSQLLLEKTNEDRTTSRKGIFCPIASVAPYGLALFVMFDASPFLIKRLIMLTNFHLNLILHLFCILPERLRGSPWACIIFNVCPCNLFYSSSNKDLSQLLHLAGVTPYGVLIKFVAIQEKKCIALQFFMAV